MLGGQEVGRQRRMMAAATAGSRPASSGLARSSSRCLGPSCSAGPSAGRAKGCSTGCREGGDTQ